MTSEQSSHLTTAIPFREGSHIEFSSLPQDVKLLIFAFLDDFTIFRRILTICKAWRQIIIFSKHCNDTFWISRTRSLLGSTSNLLEQLAFFTWFADAFRKEISEQSEAARQHCVITNTGIYQVDNQQCRSPILERRIPPPIPDASVWFNGYRQIVAQPPRVRAILRVDKQYLGLGDKVCISVTLKNITSKGIRLHRGRGFRLDECDHFTRGGALQLYHPTLGLEASRDLAHYIGPFYFCGTGVYAAQMMIGLICSETELGMREYDLALEPGEEAQFNTCMEYVYEDPAIISSRHIAQRSTSPSPIFGLRTANWFLETGSRDSVRLFMEISTMQSSFIRSDNLDINIKKPTNFIELRLDSRMPESTQQS